MQQINQKQYDSLVGKIQGLLMSNPDNGLGELMDCWDAAIQTVDKWLEENNIELN